MALQSQEYRSAVSQALPCISHVGSTHTHQSCQCHQQLHCNQHQLEQTAQVRMIDHFQLTGDHHHDQSCQTICQCGQVYYSMQQSRRSPVSCLCLCHQPWPRCHAAMHGTAPTCDQPSCSSCSDHGECPHGQTLGDTHQSHVGHHRMHSRHWHEDQVGVAGPAWSCSDMQGVRHLFHDRAA